MNLLQPNYGAAICRFCSLSVDQHAIARERMLGSGQNLYCCGQCGAAYLCPDLSTSDLNHFYQQHYRQLFPFLATSTPDEHLLRQIRSRELALLRAKRLAGRLPRAGKVLEIGSGHGAFLGRLHALRDDLQLFAVEPGSAERSLALDGAEVQFIELDEIESIGTLDLIVLFHTFEHLTDPVTLLRRLVTLSRNETRLVIEVPEAFPAGSNWAEVHPAHTSYFSAAGLQRVIQLGHWQAEVQPSCEAGNLYLEAHPCATRSAVAPVTASQRKAFLDQIEQARQAKVSPYRRTRLKVLQALLGADRVGRLSRWKHRQTLDRTLATPNRAILLGGPIDLVNQKEVIRRALEAMQQRGSLRLADLNTAKLIDMQNDNAFRMALFRAELCVADGMGVVWAARSLGIAIPERVTGIDTMAALLKTCAEQGLRPYLLGSAADVLDETVNRLQRHYPGLQLAGWHHGYFSDEEEPVILQKLQASAADCLIVGLPTPRQDLFLSQVQNSLNIPFMMGVGGSFDVLSGRLRRAPLWMQRCGCEWLFRLVQEPRRLLKRYVTTNVGLILLWLPAWLATRIRRL